MFDALLRKFSLFWSILMLVSACARELTPTGGPSDRDAPKLDSLRSTPNLLTNYQKQEIVLRFDEWLQLKDVANQVFISPPTVRKPQVTLDGKKVRISLDENEVLRPNTTYTIHLGNAIQDLNEGNPVKDMRIVFSTGPTLDSLIVQGRVTDALTGQPAKAVSVVLYAQATDSSLMKNLPDYLAFTSEDGQYRIQNVREGTYTLAAFKDDNKNNKWTVQEAVGFSDSLLVVQQPLTDAPPMTVFTSEVNQKLVSKDLGNFGEIRLTYTNPAYGTPVIPLSDSVTIRKVYLKDTIVVWYDHLRNTDWQLLVGTDSLNIKPLRRSSFIENHVLQFAVGSASKSGAKGKGKTAGGVAAPTGLSPRFFQEQVATSSQSAALPFTYPISGFDTAFIQCISGRDSSRLKSYQIDIDSINPSVLNFSFSSPTTEIYKFSFLPGALTDFWQVKNTDTLYTSFRFINGEETGNLHITISDLIPGESYVLELAVNTSLLPARVWKASQTTQRFEFNQVVPGTYTATITHDKNANGRWDTGNYMLRRQPEPIYIQRLEQVKPNWTIDAQVSLVNKPKDQKKKG